MDHRANVYNCSSSDLDILPLSVPNYTDWAWLENNKIKTLLGNAKYLNRISHLNLRHNILSLLPDSFITEIHQSENLKQLNLAHNEFTHLSVSVQKLTNLKKIWLGGNPFHCDCEMIWMIGWLNNFTTITREHVIVDYEDITCQSGMMKGKPIYKLNDVEMGCFPRTLTLWQKVGIGLGGGIAALTITSLIIWTLKRSRQFKFFVYYYLKLDTVPKDDKDENVDNMEYDAFFCFRYKLVSHLYLCSSLINITRILLSLKKPVEKSLHV